ncbi:MAG: PAS domain-containing sensor histidine kinase [Hyphomicrobiaceae bacterium]|nr:PAS domain-containing sensor histidine kinase [Hyphomicrobiaceae bacterium]
MIGAILMVASLATAAYSFAVLTGLTDTIPTDAVIADLLLINGVLIAALILVIIAELTQVARGIGRSDSAASRLHLRVVVLFSLVAALPAVLVAIVASVTLDRGLDRWFEERTQSIVNYSLTVARAYLDEHAVVLRADLISLAADFDRQRPLYDFDSIRFLAYMSTQARLHGLPYLALLNAEGREVLRARTPFSDSFRLPGPRIMAQASVGEALMIPPGDTNQVGGLIKLASYPDLYLYIARTVDPRIIQYLNTTELNFLEYRDLETRRGGVQIAFGLIFAGVALVVLLAAIWIGIGFANRLVDPIMRLINAADQVASGNLYVQVPTRGSDSDLGNLTTQFNRMTAQLRTQRDELLAANDQIDQRRRFTETVLSGVSAGVIGIDANGKVTIANRTARAVLDLGPKSEIMGQPVDKVVPELTGAISAALRDPKRVHQTQVNLTRQNGEQRSFTLRVTREEAGGGGVVTLDDVTDLLSAQRSAAWADIARRIAHEIKNPLTPIQLSAERLKRRFGKLIEQDRNIFDQCTDTIIRQVGDIGRMVDEFSTFARMPKPSFKPGNIAEVARQSVFMMGVGRSDIEIKPHIPDESIEAIFDERLIGQVLTNLLKNAMEAIGAKKEQGDDECVALYLEADDDSIIIDIADTGIGFPDANRARLLEPYMTTREKGTGLGLAIVKRIVEDHGGSIELLDASLRLEGSKGALCRVRLPRDAAHPAQSSTDTATPETDTAP